MQNIIPDTIGVLGVVLMLTAYFLLQIGKIASTSFSYSFLNCLAALMILFSLFFDWNLPSVIIEACWVLISAYGIYRYFSLKGKNIRSAGKTTS
uniref:CBU-0592-like domain-containing protein n=1 Tax=Candidatus Kentrum eta TaxID=2126337 RepID=A0A450UWE8_9GAMM|nr:MAG: hypothetical protein BECKH772A_GA0070896_100109 [Candidatus Kentron sp. H]VFJ90684.1 MAG: hypothetical protein BECKH772B_GA0070898_100119 [Candidatus Kentron sp. H]VFJ96847.1 MAG: hypothetical protein BECKH772C_GA0070978_100099 [Candidatus Kentron sp. H]